jgi:hypothetical protein
VADSPSCCTQRSDGLSRSANATLPLVTRRFRGPLHPHSFNQAQRWLLTYSCQQQSFIVPACHRGHRAEPGAKGNFILCSWHSASKSRRLRQRIQKLPRAYCLFLPLSVLVSSLDFFRDNRNFWICTRLDARFIKIFAERASYREVPK